MAQRTRKQERRIKAGLRVTLDPRWLGEMQITRQRAGYTQRAAGEALGVTRAAIGRYEDGSREMPAELFVRYCDLLRQKLDIEVVVRFGVRSES